VVLSLLCGGLCVGVMYLLLRNKPGLRSAVFGPADRAPAEPRYDGNAPHGGPLAGHSWEHPRLKQIPSDVGARIWPRLCPMMRLATPASAPPRPVVSRRGRLRPCQVVQSIEFLEKINRGGDGGNLQGRQQGLKNRSSV